MKNQPARDEVREDPRRGLKSGVTKNQDGQANEVQARSDPLKSNYNSTFIILVLSIAAILAFILIFWPSGGF